MSEPQDNLPASMTALTIRLDDELFAVEAGRVREQPVMATHVFGSLGSRKGSMRGLWL